MLTGHTSQIRLLLHFSMTLNTKVYAFGFQIKNISVVIKILIYFYLYGVF